MASPSASPDLVILDAADRVGRTAYLWLRRQVVSQDIYATGDPPGGDRRLHFLVAGFISQLCDNLQLTLQHGLLAAHTYALLEDSDADSLAVAAILFAADSVPPADAVFERGRSMADELLDQLDEAGHGDECAVNDAWPVSRFDC